MLIRRVFVAWIVLLTLAASAWAQFQEGDPDGATLGEAQVQRLRIGVVVTAAGGACRGIVAYTAVPTDWPEQEVRIVEEDVSPAVKVNFQMVDNMARCMEVKIPYITAGQEVRALITFEVRRSPILPPDATDEYELPNAKKLPRDLRIYLGPSPLIESRNRKIRKLAKEVGVDEEKAWDRVEAIYDWVREKVNYENGPIKGALAALNDGTGDCEELTSLFVAICRAGDIPARTVWVEGHCYPEFYLLDGEGKGHWFPCQAAGSRAFGGIPESRAVLQKGDNIRPPYSRRDKQRYLADHLTGAGGRPKVRFVREVVSE